jgi:hypothetical protein
MGSYSVKWNHIAKLNNFPDGLEQTGFHFGKLPTVGGHFNGYLFSSVLCIFVKKLRMTTQDIKKKINKVIDEVPESYLPDILSYLNQIKKSAPNNIDTLQNFRKILKEDRTLLQMLAK